jgi:hypothetical protein
LQFYFGFLYLSDAKKLLVISTGADRKEEDVSPVQGHRTSSLKERSFCTAGKNISKAGPCISSGVVKDPLICVATLDEGGKIQAW